MPPELRLVSNDPPAGHAAAICFRADAGLRLWGAGVAALLAVAATMLGYQRTVEPLFAAPAAALFFCWALYLAVGWLSQRAVSYTLTAQRLEIEAGLLGKRFESIELWRVRDVVLEQGLPERLRGAGRITVLSSDQAEPVLRIGPVLDAHRHYEELRDAVAVARRTARVVPLDAGG